MSDQLLAVTIAIGEKHSALARIAAERMRRHTGLQVKVLGPEHLQPGQSPFDLKFHLFQLTRTENVLYFDADVFCLRPWDPRVFCNQPEWLAVRGWWFDPWVHRLGSTYGFGEDIFNGGMFLCNRTHHERMLRLAQSLQPQDGTFHDLRNPDEIALGTARAALNIPIRFLDRRYNWVHYGRGSLADRADVVLAHACDRQLSSLYSASEGGMLKGNDHAAERGAIPDELADRTYIYDRLGHDLRPLHFRKDGTIGQGGGAAERFYFLTSNEGIESLVIGSEDDETCLLRKDGDGTWRGRWTHHERMPIILTKHRAQVVIDLLRERFGANNHLTGVEVGVCQGETSAILLRELPGLKLYLVDPWRAALDAPSCWLGTAAMSQRMFDDAMLNTARLTEFAAARRTLVPCTSTCAAESLPNDLDFVFIDADHSYSGVLSDIAAWRPKLASNGLLCGHDYGNPNFPGVKKAVDESALRTGMAVRTGPDMVWYYERVDQES